MAERTDADRFRFLSAHKLSLTWYDNGVSLSWREQHPEPGTSGGYRPIARASTLKEAVDAAIARWERQHGKSFP